jgi:hypothetical protein
VGVLAATIVGVAAPLCPLPLFPLAPQPARSNVAPVMTVPSRNLRRINPSNVIVGRHETTAQWHERPRRSSGDGHRRGKQGDNGACRKIVRRCTHTPPSQPTLEPRSQVSLAGKCVYTAATEIAPQAGCLDVRCITGTSPRENRFSIGSCACLYYAACV